VHLSTNARETEDQLTTTAASFPSKKASRPN